MTGIVDIYTIGSTKKIELPGVKIEWEIKNKKIKNLNLL